MPLDLHGLDQVELFNKSVYQIGLDATASSD
jgi:hypothetical protein